MEERVRICDGCGAVVGWFARFCEECGTPQAPKAEPTFAAESGGGAPGALATGGAAAAVAAAATAVAEDGAVVDVRTAARELFRAQLRLMHRTSEQAEALVADIRGIRADCGRRRRRGSAADRREATARLSERLMSAEAAWDELQRVYNRESEAAEEEWQANAEGAQIDAYLTPAEEEAVAGEFAALQRRFEIAETELREAGRDVALARKEAHSRIFGLSAASPGVFLGFGAAAVGLCGVSFAAALEGRDAASAIAVLSPAAVAVALMAMLAARRG